MTSSPCEKLFTIFITVKHDKNVFNKMNLIERDSFTGVVLYGVKMFICNTLNGCT